MNIRGHSWPFVAIHVKINSSRRLSSSFTPFYYFLFNFLFYFQFFFKVTIVLFYSLFLLPF